MTTSAIVVIVLLLLLLYTLPSVWLGSLLWLVGGGGYKKIPEALLLGFAWPAFIWGNWV